MNGKLVKRSLLILGLCAIVLGIVAKVIEMFSVPSVDPSLVSRMSDCKSIARCIETYYQQNSTGAPPPHSFAEFAVRSDPRFSMSKPETPSPILNIELYLVLPESLAGHTGEAIIAYTDPIRDGKHKGKRCGVILRGEAVAAIVLSPQRVPGQPSRGSPQREITRSLLLLQRTSPDAWPVADDRGDANAPAMPR